MDDCRAITVATLVVLATNSCGGEVSPPIAEQGGTLVECAPSGQSPFGDDCTAERQGSEIVVVRNPDGSFHRLRLLPGGRGYGAADGADAVDQELADSVSTLSIGGDRYVLPLVWVEGADAR